MNTQTIDHHTLSTLAESGHVKDIVVIGQPQGWEISIKIKYEKFSKLLSATRSKKIRFFRKLETAIFYLKDLGINRVSVDGLEYDSHATTRSRPDRIQALKQVHAAAEYDKWFRMQVSEGLEEVDNSQSVFVSHEKMKSQWAAKRTELLHVKKRK